jgi:uncharacterized protein
VITLATSAFVVYSAFLAALYYFQDRMLFPGTAIAIPNKLPNVLGLQLIELPEKDGNRPVAFFLPANAPAGIATGAMILAHGIGEIADSSPEIFTHWRQMGIAVLVIEYPGYGRASGTPSERSISHAMTSAFDWLANRKDIDKTKIFAHGISLGGGAVGLLMRERPLAAVILHSTFTSLREFSSSYFAPSFLLKNKFDTIDAVRSSKIPVRVVHGQNDPLIPVSQAAALAHAANDRMFQPWSCGHVCFHEGGRPLFDAAREFLLAHGVVSRLN